MAAVANIVLNDALATPVAHTFIPIGQDKLGVWWWEDQSVPQSIGFNRISLAFSRASNPSAGSNAGSRINRVKIAIHTPKLETLGNNSAGLLPPSQVAYVPRCMVEFVLPERAILQDRKDIRKYVDFLVADALMTDVIENLRNVY